MSLGEPDFPEHKREAGEAIFRALDELSDVRAYVLAENELEEFKEAHLALRELAARFEEYEPEELRND